MIRCGGCGFIRPRPSSSMAVYNLQQQSFTMSFLSYAVSGVVGTAETLQEELRDRVSASLTDQKFMEQIGSGWEIAWGPVVYQAMLSDYADDSMLVLRRTSDG